MTSQVVLTWVAAFAATFVLIGLPAHLAIVGFRKFKDWANAQVRPLYEEGIRISSADRSRSVLQYAVTGFMNVGIEWQQTIFVDKKNIQAVEDLIARTAKLSYRLSITSGVGILLGTLLTWMNHRIARAKLTKYKRQLGL